MSLRGSCAAAAEADESRDRATEDGRETKQKANKAEKTNKFIIFLTEKLRRFEAWERESVVGNEKNRFTSDEKGRHCRSCGGWVWREILSPRYIMPALLCLHQLRWWAFWWGKVKKEEERGAFLFIRPPLLTLIVLYYFSYFHTCLLLFFIYAFHTHTLYILKIYTCD